MTRRRKGPVHAGTISALDATRAQKPQFNGFACGHGPHGDARYNRRKEEQELRRVLHEEGGHGRPPFSRRDGPI